MEYLTGVVSEAGVAFWTGVAPGNGFVFEVGLTSRTGVGSEVGVVFLVFIFLTGLFLMVLTGLVFIDFT